jgi:hypothetical protein
MAAKAAASVVWLTVDVIITFTPGLLSAFSAALTDLTDFASACLADDFDSDFLFVTGAFDCTGADFAATFDNGFAFADFATEDLLSGLVVFLTATLGCGFVALAATFTGALTDSFPVFLAEATALVFAGDLGAVVFFIAGFAVDLDEVDLAAEGLGVFSVRTGDFAGFFIAFAIEFLPIKLLFLHSRSMHIAN